MPDTTFPPMVFESVSNRRLRGVASIGGGVLLLLVVVGGFFLSLRSNSGFVRFHLMTTMPAILAVGLFASGYATLRLPTLVTVGDHDLTVARGQSEIGRWRWEELALAPIGNAPISSKKILKLYDGNGKRLVTLSDDLGDFEVMRTLIQRRMSEHPSSQRANVALRKARRNGVMLMVGAVLFFALAIVNARFAMSEREAAMLLQTQAKPAEAVIVRKLIAPDGRTHRIEYRVDVAGAPVANVEVSPVLWAMVQPRQHIPVMAVPGRPDVSRLVAGQIDDAMSADPRMMLFLSAGIGAMSIVFFIVGYWSWRGVNLKWDRQRRRPMLAPVGGD